MPVVVSSAPSRPRSGSRPGSPWRRRCPRSTTPAGWRPCSCSPATWSTEPLLPVDGMLPVRRPAVVVPRGWPRSPPRRPGGRTGGRTGWRPCGPCGRIVARDRTVDRAGACAGRSAPRRARAHATSVLGAGLAQRAALLRGVRRRRRPGWSGCTPASTSARPASSPSGWPGGSHRPVAVVTTSGTAVANLHPAVLEAAHAGRHRSSPSPPTARRGCAAPAPTRPPTRSASSAPPPPFADLDHPGPRRPRRRLARPAARSTSTSSSTTRWCPTRTGGGRTSCRRACRGRSRDGDADLPAQTSHARRRRAHRGGGRRRRRAARPTAGRGGRAGRCWPSRAAGRAPATHAIRSYRLLLGTALGERDRAGRGLRAPDAVAPGARGCSRATTSRSVDAPRPGAGRRGPSRSTPSTVDARRGRGPTTTGLARPSGATADARAVRRDLDALLADRARPHAVRRRGAPSTPPLPPGGLLVVGASQPDPRPRPDGRRATRSASAAR